MTAHKIMVVDDNSATRRMVRNALQRNGHDVVEAPDGKTARALMKSEHPCLVIQDLMLPDADGFTLVGELRDIAGATDVSILAFSGFVSDLDEARMSSVGFDDIIPKPIAPSRLVPLVEAHLPTHTPTPARFGAGRRLVIADDDPLQLKLATFRMSRLGFDVEGVSDGKSALDAIRRKRPDAIISDVMMPELDGFALAMAIRQEAEFESLPIVLVTSSYVEPGDRELARRAGANDLVPRTPELLELVDKLRETLTGPARVVLAPEALGALEYEHNQRVFRQLERQVLLNTGLARRCSVLSSELAVLAGISEAVLKRRDVDVALDDALAECFDAGGISVGALYLVEGERLRVRPIGSSTVVPLLDELRTLYGHESLLREMIQSRATMEIPSATSDLPTRAIEQDLLRRANATAMLMVPVVHLEHTLGTLLMVARGRELDRDDWRAFAHGVATQVSHVLTLARAFADREEAERRATDHAALLDAVIENAPDYVARLDLDGTIRFINRALPGFALDELVGKCILDIGSGESGTSTRSAIERLVATGAPQGVEYALTRGGKQTWFSSRLGPIRQNTEIVGVVLIMRDVTETKQTEMHLMVADRMASVGTLAAGVAHEINNPLASVIANLDMALQDIQGYASAALPSELAEELQDARTAADRVREIVRDLKIFSRAEEDRRGPVDIQSVLESTIRMAWNELRHRAKLVKQFTKVPDIDANESRLGQVFLNLIINAAHAIPEGKHDANQIRVSTRVDDSGHNVVVTIADTGAGIPPEVIPRLFTPFFTTKPVGVGTGLGLAISHRIVTQFGGTITFETEVGKGTQFHVSLPISGGARVAQARTTTNKSLAVRRGRVLVVDDEEPLAQAIRRFLSHDHDVTAVFSAGAALDLIRAGERYDLIFCDLMMPQVTGMELHAELFDLDPRQANAVVFLTGGAFTIAAREFLDRVSNRRLEKPFDLKELRRLVNELVR